MKRTFLLISMLVVTGMMMAQTTYSHTITEKMWSAWGIQNLSGINWDAQGDGEYFGYDTYNNPSKGQQFGSASKPCTWLTLSTSGILGTVTEIILNTSGGSSVAATVGISVGGSAFTCEGETNPSITNVSTDYDFVGSGQGDIVISWAQTSSKALYFLSITVIYTEGPAVLTANFSGEPTTISIGESVSFTDLTFGGTPTSWEWEFEGGTPAVSTEQNPVVTYNNGGTYNVTLTVSDGETTHSKTIENYITVKLPTVNILYQDWNDEDWKGWSQISILGDQVWAIASVYGIDDSPCARMTGYVSGVSYPNEDWLISPAFNLDAYENVVLSFYNAYSYQGNAMEVFFSNDYENDPSTATWESLTYTPSAGYFGWTFSGDIELSSFSGTNCYIGFKYTNTAEQSSTWEVDNIQISTTAVAIAETEKIDFQLSPNPCNGQFSIKMNEEAQVSVYSILGQLVHQQNIDGNATINLGNAVSGIYIVKVQTETGAVATRKVIVK